MRRLAHRDIEQYLKARLKERTRDPVGKERFTQVKLFEWAVAHDYLETSPAAGLPAIKGDADNQPLRTVAEILAIQIRVGLAEAEAAALWDTLYRTPAEIGTLLQLVRERSLRTYLGRPAAR